MLSNSSENSKPWANFVNRIKQIQSPNRYKCSGEWIKPSELSFPWDECFHWRFTATLAVIPLQRHADSFLQIMNPPRASTWDCLFRSQRSVFQMSSTKDQQLTVISNYLHFYSCRDTHVSAAVTGTASRASHILIGIFLFLHTCCGLSDFSFILFPISPICWLFYLHLTNEDFPTSFQKLQL